MLAAARRVAAWSLLLAIAALMAFNSLPGDDSYLPDDQPPVTSTGVVVFISLDEVCLEQARYDFVCARFAAGSDPAGFQKGDCVTIEMEVVLHRVTAISDGDCRPRAPSGGA